MYSDLILRNMDFLVVKSGAMIMLFTALFLPFHYVVNKKLKNFGLSVVPSALIAFLIILGFFYRLNPLLYIKQTSKVAEILFEGNIIPIVIGVGIVAAGFALALLLPKKLSQQEYRSLFHMVGGFLILYFLSINRALAYIIVTIMFLAYCVADYIRLSNAQGVILDFLRQIFNIFLGTPARAGERRVYVAGPSFLLGILIVLLLLPGKFVIAAILMLCIGDPSAVLVGRRIGRHKWKWNPDKSLEGSAAMFIISSLLLIILGIEWWVAAAVAISVAAFESLPLKISDNFVIPVVTGMILVGTVNGIGIEPFSSDLLYITLIPVLLGLFVYATGMLDLLGTLAVVFFSVLIMRASGLPYLATSACFLLLGAGFTFYKQDYKKGLYSPEKPGFWGSLIGRIKRFYKKQLHPAGVKESPSINPVIANGAIPAFAAILGNPYLFVGSLSAGLSDIMATEVGILYGQPVLMTTGEKVRPGTRGAISIIGELTALAGALIVTSIAILFIPGLRWPELTIIAIISGLAGCNLDSLMSAGLKFLSKEEVNVVATLVGAAVAGGLVIVFGL